MKISVIHTKHLNLRNYQKTDKEFAMSIWNDPEMGKYLPDPSRENLDEKYLKALDELEADEECCYLIAQELETGERVGTCSFVPSEDGKIYDLGCCVHEKYQNRGYATEMEQAMIDYAREHGAEKITAPVNKENKASNAVMKKLGFSVVGETTCKKRGTDIILEEYLYELEVKP